MVLETNIVNILLENTVMSNIGKEYQVRLFLKLRLAF